MDSKPKLVFGDSDGRFRIYNRNGFENTGNEKFVCQRAKQKSSARVAKKVSGEYEIYYSHLPSLNFAIVAQALKILAKFLIFFPNFPKCSIIKTYFLAAFFNFF